MKKIIEKIEALVGGIPADKALHFIAGMLISAIVAIVAPAIEGFSFVIAFAAGLSKEVFDMLINGYFDDKDILATSLGGLMMQVFV